MRVETDPPGATASADGQKVFTPGVLKLHRKQKTLEVLFEKEGYVSWRVTLTRSGPDLVQTNWALGLVGGATTKSFVGVVALPVAALAHRLRHRGGVRLEPPEIFLRLEPVNTAEPDVE